MHLFCSFPFNFSMLVGLLQLGAHFLELELALAILQPFIH